MNRKVFIQTAGRWGILGLLTLLAAIFIKRKALKIDPECNPEFCDQCSLRHTCNRKESVSINIKQKS